MNVWAVERIRIDTTDDDGKVLKLYVKKEKAEKHAANLNELYERDNSKYRAHVTPQSVDTTD